MIRLGAKIIYIWVNSIALAHSAFLFIFVEMKECVLPACERYWSYYVLWKLTK